MHLVFLASFFLYFGCGDESANMENPDVAAKEIEVDRGRKLFVRNGCQTCHGAEGRGDGALAASLHPKPRDFSDPYAYKKGSTVEQIAITIATGLPPAMPGYDHLNGKRRRRIAKFIASLQAEPTSGSGVESTNGIRAEAAWTRVSLAPHQATAAYLVLHNDSDEDDLLLGVEAAVAGGVEFHLSTHEGDMMTMRRVEQLAVPAAGNIQLEPGGLHLMLTDLKRPILVGEQLKFVLRFEHAIPLTVTAEVRAP